MPAQRSPKEPAMLTSRTFSDASIHVGVHQRRRPLRALRVLAACAITAGLAAAPASAATPQLDQQWSGPWAMAHCVYSHWIAEEQMSSGLTVGVNIAFVPTVSGRL